MRAARLFIVGLLGLLLVSVGLVAAGGQAGAAPPELGKRKAVVTQTYRVEVVGQLYATQANNVAYYYCAVGVFVAFNSGEGYDETKGDLTIGGVATTIPIGDPPYDDNLVVNTLVFKPYVGQHHVLVGGLKEFYASGPVNANQQCGQLRDDTDAATSDTATVTYQAVGACAKAIAKVDKAADAVKKAKKKLKGKSGAALDAAQAALARAKTKLRNAETKADRTCAPVGRHRTV